MKKASVLLTIMLAAVMIFILPAKSKGQDEKKECKHKHEKSEITVSGVNIKNVGDDSVVITINKKEHCDVTSLTNWSTFPFCCKKGKFNGHWAGVDFGWNGYVNKNFNMTFPDKEKYLDLNTARSLMVNLNPIELNVNIARNKFGFTSGIGFTLNNYYFDNSFTWLNDSAKLVAYNTVDDKGNAVSMKVNKLYVSYITLPLLLEYQTNPGHRLSSFHITAGVIGGIRLQSYQKQRLYQWNDTYYLVDASGTKVASFTPGHPVIRNHHPYHLNLFKLDATVRIGWSFLNFFSTYSLIPMFQKDEGPVVYPWTVGITLIGW